MLTPPDHIRDWIAYDRDTGQFHWLKSKHGVRPAKRADRPMGKRGYRRVNFEYQDYMAHRLAWWFVHGAMPEFEIDHIDRDPSNNKLANLRLSTRTQNTGNRGPNVGKAHNYKGVYQRGAKWIAQLGASGRSRYLGTFATAGEAARAYDAAAKGHFGQYAKCNFEGGVQ